MLCEDTGLPMRLQLKKLNVIITFTVTNYKFHPNFTPTNLQVLIQPLLVNIYKLYIETKINLLFIITHG